MSGKTILFCVVLLVSSLSNKAQWIQQNSGTTNTLYEVHFPVPDTGYVVGFERILKSVDRGSNWVSLDSSISASSIHFINANVGFVTAGYGSILKTIDGGTTWISQYADSSFDLTSIHFVNSSIGFAAGAIYQPERSIILKTLDGGGSWNTTLINDSAGGVIKDIHFPIPETGYALYSTGILKSVDAGESWYLLIDKSFPEFDDVSPNLETCYFTDTNTGYIGGWYNATLFKTTDGGNKWINLDSPITLDLGIFSMYFPNSDTGYAVGQNKKILKTSNAGISWEVQYADLNVKLRSVFFTDVYTGYAVGEHGIILKTVNGGVGINENDFGTALTIYPNPTTGKLTIALGQSYQKIQLFDISGKEQQIEFTADFVDLGRLLEGLYFIRLTLENGQSVIKKIMKIEAR